MRWKAYDSLKSKVIGWLLGKRDDDSCKKLISSMGIEDETFITYNREGYIRIIPREQYMIGRIYTVGMEQDNSNITLLL